MPTWQKVGIAIVVVIFLFSSPSTAADLVNQAIQAGITFISSLDMSSP